MKAIGFLVDYGYDLVDCIAYIPTPMYHDVHHLYNDLRRNGIELGWELEYNGHDDLYDMIASYAALSVCMYCAANDIHEYMWDVDFCLDDINFTPNANKFDADVYAKSLFYSQWRIENYIVNRIVLHNPDRARYIRKITKRHNERYTEKYIEWCKHSNNEEYMIEQYRKEIDARVKTKKLTVLDLDNYAKKFACFGLSQRCLMVLLRKLDMVFENINTNRPESRQRIRSYSSEYGTKREEYKEPPSKSIRPIYNRNGGK